MGKSRDIRARYEQGNKVPEKLWRNVNQNPRGLIYAGAKIFIVVEIVHNGTGNSCYFSVGWNCLCSWVMAPGFTRNIDKTFD